MLIIQAMGIERKLKAYRVFLNTIYKGNRLYFILKVDMGTKGVVVRGWGSWGFQCSILLVFYHIIIKSNLRICFKMTNRKSFFKSKYELSEY